MIEGHLGVGPAEMALRLGLAALTGSLLGLDRELSHHPAGLRTHAIVSLSAAVITLSALSLFDQVQNTHASSDPLRVIQGLAQAIGFIAAGLIFVKGGTVRNLTTAAMLWLATAIGIACGAGQYVLVGLSAAFGLVLVVLFRIVERRLHWRSPNREEE